MPAVRRVVVVGAGVAGPTLALALEHLGVEVELVGASRSGSPLAWA